MLLYLYHNGNKYTAKYNSDKIICTAHRKIEFYFDTCILKLFNDTKLLYKIEQKLSWKKFLANTIGLSLIFKNQYSLFNGDDVEIASFTKGKACSSVFYCNHNYTVRVHTASYISMWKDGLQIGLMKHKNYKYNVILDDTNIEDLEFIMLLFIFSTFIFLRTKTASYSYCLIPSDKYKDAIYYHTPQGESLYDK